MHRTFVKAAIAVSGAAVLAATAAATPASADSGTASVLYKESAGLADCPSGWVCLWQNRDYGGAIFGWREGGYNVDFRTLLCAGCNGGNFHDDASSWANFTRRKYCVSWGTSGGDPDNTMPSAGAGNFTPEWNDQASSIGFLGCP